MARDWSQREVSIIVEDYLSMLLCELKGEAYNKAERNRSLQARLENRSRGSIEMKHMNISAVMSEAGYPCIDGYKPARNYQRRILPEIVEEQVSGHVELNAMIQALNDSVKPTIPTVTEILSALVEAPQRADTRPYLFKETESLYLPRKVDYLERDAANSKLGLLGEKFAVNFEKARLIEAGKQTLADQIEHTSQCLGDGAGYDLRSYEVNGTDRFIEVKTTKYSRHTPFFMTRNELNKSVELAPSYYLYRVFNFHLQPKLFSLKGDMNLSLSLEPTQYLAWV